MNPSTQTYAGQPSSFYASTGGVPQEGAWYGGRQYINGTLSNPGQINSQSTQQGAGQQVSNAVISQTNPNNVGYVQQQQQTFQPTNPNNPTEAGAGGGGYSANPSAPAIPNLSDIYAKAYTNNPDVIAAQAQVKTLQDQLTARQQALDAATKDINDNPFYAEATRNGKQAQLNSEAENDMNTLNNQITTQQGIITNAQAEADRQSNIAQGQYSLDNQAYQQNIQEFNNLISAGGLDNLSASDIASLSVSTGISPAMLTSIQQSSKNKNVQVSTVQGSDGLHVIAIDGTTGNVVNQEVIPGVKGSSGQSAYTQATEQYKLDQQEAPSYAVTAAQAGKTLPDMLTTFSQYGMTSQQIYDIYNSVNYYHATPEQQAADKARYNVK